MKIINNNGYYSDRSDKVHLNTKQLITCLKNISTLYLDLEVVYDKIAEDLKIYNTAWLFNR